MESECRACEDKQTIACRHVDGELMAFVMELRPGHALGRYVAVNSDPAFEGQLLGRWVYHGDDRDAAIASLDAS